MVGSRLAVAPPGQNQHNVSHAAAALTIQEYGKHIFVFQTMLSSGATKLPLIAPAASKFLFPKLKGDVDGAV